MQAELVAYTQQNPALDPAQLAGQSDLATIWQGAGAYPDQLIEYAGRVCYRSTQRMGTAPTFISARVREGHEDIIEHVVATVRFRGGDDPLRWRMLNRHCEVSELGAGDWLVSGNTRVWLHLFRQGAGLEALPILAQISPAVFAEFSGMMADEQADKAGDAAVSHTPLRSATLDMDELLPVEDGPMRVTLLGYTQPLLDDPALLVDHGAATFLFEGVSRTCTHQLVRHRLASFSQESQRYVDLDRGGWKAVVPEAVRDNPQAMAELDEFWRAAEEKYARLPRTGHPQRGRSLLAAERGRDAHRYDHELCCVEPFSVAARRGQSGAMGDTAYGPACSDHAARHRPGRLRRALAGISGALRRRRMTRRLHRFRSA